MHNLIRQTYNRDSLNYIEYYGPTDPIAFCGKLYNIGIRELNLGETTFHQSFPTGLRQIHNRQLFNNETNYCVSPKCFCSCIVCAPCALFGMLCCISPSSWIDYLLNCKANARITQENQQWIGQFSTTMSKFEALGLSLSKDDVLNDIFMRSLKEHRITDLRIFQFELLTRSTSMIVDFFSNLFANNRLQQLTLAQTSLFMMKGPRIMVVAEAIGKSNLKSLVILPYPKKYRPTVLQFFFSCNALLEACKDNTTLLNLDFTNCFFYNDAIFHYAAYKRRYVELLTRTKELMMRNLAQYAASANDEASIVKIISKHLDEYPLIEKLLKQEHLLTSDPVQPVAGVGAQALEDNRQLIDLNRRLKLVQDLCDVAINTSASKVVGTLNEASPNDLKPNLPLVLEYMYTRCQFKLDLMNNKSKVVVTIAAKPLKEIRYTI